MVTGIATKQRLLKIRHPRWYCPITSVCIQSYTHKTLVLPISSRLHVSALIASHHQAFYKSLYR